MLALKIIKGFLGPEKAKDIEKAEPLVTYLYEQIIKPEIQRFELIEKLSKENNAMLRLLLNRIAPEEIDLLRKKRIIL